MAIIVYLIFIIIIDSLSLPKNSAHILPNRSIFLKANLLQGETAIVTGTVSDNEGKPLMYANVFISNTTIGTISDENGEYRLSNIPLGQYILVVSYLGYDQKRIPIDINKDSLTLHIQLVERTLEIDEVEIQTRKSKNRWKQNFKQFETNFIGISDNAHSCKIINPEVLRFHYNNKTKVLSANANEPIIVENLGLG